MSIIQLATSPVNWNVLEQALKDVLSVRVAGHMILRLAVKVSVSILPQGAHVIRSCGKPLASHFPSCRKQIFNFVDHILKINFDDRRLNDIHDVEWSSFCGRK